MTKLTNMRAMFVLHDRTRRARDLGVACGHAQRGAMAAS